MIDWTCPSALALSPAPCPCPHSAPSPWPACLPAGASRVQQAGGIPPPTPKAWDCKPSGCGAHIWVKPCATRPLSVKQVLLLTGAWLLGPGSPYTLLPCLNFIICNMGVTVLLPGRVLKFHLALSEPEQGCWVGLPPGSWLGGDLKEGGHPLGHSVLSFSICRLTAWASKVVRHQAAQRCLMLPA